MNVINILFDVVKFTKRFVKIFSILLFILFVLWIFHIVLNPVIPNENQSLNRVKQFVANVNKDMIPSMNMNELFSLAEIKHYGKYDSVKDLRAAHTLYTQSAEASSERKHIGKCYLSMGNLFYESKDAEKAIEHYLKAIENGFEEGIIRIAKLYSFGIHPYVLPDKLFAAKLFSRYMHLSDTLQQWCKFYIQELNGMSYNDIDTLSYNNVIQSKTLPTNILERFDSSVEKMKEGELFPYNKYFNNAWIETLREENENNVAPKNRRSILESIPKQEIINDSQNVHDHGLQNSAKRIIHHLETAQNSDPVPSTEHTFETDVAEFKKLTGVMNDDIEMTIDSLGTTIHSKYDKSEQEVFSMIWNRVKTNPDMVTIFTDNLSSAVEDGIVVCSTGKIMRMLSTLDVVDEEIPDLKPTWAIRNELAQMVSSEIQNTLQTFDIAHRNAFNSSNPTEDQQQMVVNVTDKIKENVIERAIESYVKPNILDESVLMFELQVFLNNI